MKYGIVRTTPQLYGWTYVCLSSSVSISKCAALLQFGLIQRGCVSRHCSFQKRNWLQLVLETLLIHPNRHTCPFPVSVYYTAMILLWRLPLQWNTICFQFSLISFSHHSRQAFAKPKALRKLRFCHSFYFFLPDMSQNISNRWGFKLIYSHNKRAQHFNSIVSNFKLIQ